MVKIFDLIDKVKKINPLILHYTNNVTIQIVQMQL